MSKIFHLQVASILTYIGRTREEQKEKQSKLEERWKPEPGGIAKSFKKIGERVAKLYWRRDTGFVRFYTDEYNQYEKGLLKDIDLSRMKNQEGFGKFCKREYQIRKEHR